MDATPIRFSEFAVVEVMGHSSYAGLVTEHCIGGAPFIRVDVPEVEGRAGFTKLLGAGSIFAITLCSRETTIEYTTRNRTRPLQSVDLVAARVPALPGFIPPEYDADADD